MKVIVMLMALAGVFWMMTTLKSGTYINDPNSPVQMLIGGQPETASSAEGIPAKVQFDQPKPTSGTNR